MFAHAHQHPTTNPRPVISTHRKATLDSLRLDKQAEAFAGLPAGVSHPLHLLETFKRAAPELKIPRAVITLVDHLFRHTNPLDWQPGTRPIVWPSNATLALSLDISESALGAAIRAASGLGFVVMKDSPTRRRNGQRDKAGAVIAAVSYGFDLSPLAIRHPELAAAASRRDAFIKAHAAARRAVTITAHKLAQIIQTAHDQALWSPAWAGLQHRLDGLAIPRRFASLGLAEIEHYAHRLSDLEADARQLLPAEFTTPDPGTSQEMPDSTNPIPCHTETESQLSENREPMNSPTNDPTGLESTAGGAALDEANVMIDAFTSVGATSFDITRTDVDQQKKAFLPNQSADQLRRALPDLLSQSAEHQTNLIIRPRTQHQPPPDASNVTLIQLDDLEPVNLAEIEPMAFLTVQTSAAGTQAWVAVKDAPKGLATRLKKGLLADLNASGAVRMAGSANYKRAYQPAFPVVRVLTAAPGLTITVDELAALGVLAPEPPPRPAVASRSFSPSRTTKWPDYDRCLTGAPIGPSGRPQRTKADFVWAKIAISWGHSVEATAAMLIKVSTKAQENGQGYAIKTAEHAAYAAAHR